ncbi:MAG: hypothetical protein COZ23_05715 [Hydrogenophilales bacterium CG_4_10_14_3_um_filter_58_23]|nr:MAG: hypothetical protein COW70_15055 [Hydrogenophilales bacterium CG18_big_fil_WC_8_21_14_2_50_58_12]PIY00986.1 MAG: hypothetical protein COZ23_05715 [Hydrogenophilales bacterium CG_4_10_14_3_um_filter_58_23]
MNGNKNCFQRHGAGPASPARRTQRDGAAVALHKKAIFVPHDLAVFCEMVWNLAKAKPALQSD